MELPTDQPSQQEDQGAEGNEGRFQASRHVSQRRDISGTSISLGVDVADHLQSNAVPCVFVRDGKSE